LKGQGKGLEIKRAMFNLNNKLRKNRRRNNTGNVRISVRVGARARAYACAQAPYFLRRLWLHPIFRHHLINGTILGGGGKLLNIKRVLISLQLLFETFLILIIILRDIVMNVKTCSCKVPVIFV
jgi:hypothetical protein